MRRHPSLDAVSVVTGGVGLIALLAWTALTGRRRMQAVLFYTAGAVVALALGSRAAAPATHLPSAVALGVLVAALLWRVGWERTSGVSPPS